MKKQIYQKGTKIKIKKEVPRYRDVLRPKPRVMKGRILATIIGKTYTSHNFPLTAWCLMKAALGREGTGAGSVY